MPDDQSPDDVLLIDGDVFELSDADLTFREQIKLRTFIRDLSGDPSLQVTDAMIVEFLPALVAVIKQRTDHSYQLEQALDLKYADVVGPRPTEPAAKAPKRSGGAGAQST
jgi:hypothetical protein